MEASPRHAIHRLVVDHLCGLGHGVFETRPRLPPSKLPSRWFSESGPGGQKKRPKMSTHIVPDLGLLAALH